ncbi:hypothetical protein HK096_003945 [Nowakowskiella sp. JEL0078]|nr:hypothetical protein HK096_003945 [Nowakowskiella sp. JEL0078]
MNPRNLTEDEVALNKVISLKSALSSSQYQTVKTLLKNDANPSLDPLHSSPGSFVYFALRKDLGRVVKLVNAVGLNLEICTFCLLNWQPDPEKIRLFFELGGSVNVNHSHREFTCHRLNASLEPVFKVLMEIGVDLTERDDDGKTILHQIAYSAANEGRDRSGIYFLDFQFLLSTKIFNLEDIEADITGNNVLDYAIQCKTSYYALELIRRGAKISGSHSCQESFVNAALHILFCPPYGCIRDHFFESSNYLIELLDFLIESVPDILKASNLGLYGEMGFTMLHLSVKSVTCFDFEKRMSVLKILLDLGADSKLEFHALDKYLKSPLDYAENSSLLEIMLVYVPLSDSMTEVLAARYFENRIITLEILKILCNKNKNLVSTSLGIKKKTLLHYSVEILNYDMVDFLLEQVSNICTVDIHNQTPLDYSLDCNNPSPDAILDPKRAKMIEKLLRLSDNIPISYKQAKLLMYIGAHASVEIISIVSTKYPELVNTLCGPQLHQNRISTFLISLCKKPEATISVSQHPIIWAIQAYHEDQLPLIITLINLGAKTSRFKPSLLETAVIYRRYSVIHFLAHRYPTMANKWSKQSPIYIFTINSKNCKTEIQDTAFLKAFSALVVTTENILEIAKSFRILLKYAAEIANSFERLQSNIFLSSIKTLLPLYRRVLGPSLKVVDNNNAGWLEKEWMVKIVHEREVLSFLWIWKLKCRIHVPLEVIHFIKGTWKL